MGQFGSSVGTLRQFRRNCPALQLVLCFWVSPGSLLMSSGCLWAPSGVSLSGFSGDPGALPAELPGSSAGTAWQFRRNCEAVPAELPDRTMHIYIYIYIYTYILIYIAYVHTYIYTYIHYIYICMIYIHTHIYIYT